MNTIIRSTGLAILVALLSMSTASAQDTNAGEATDPVYLFNEICYTQVPGVDQIQDMATRFAWEPMSDKDIERFASVKTPSYLRGWDIRMEERIYRLALVQSAPQDSFIETFPDLANATATSCSLVLDGRDSADTIFERMQVLVGKDPVTRDVEEGTDLTTTWAGGNDTVKVFVFMKSDKTGRANLLNVTLVLES